MELNLIEGNIFTAKNYTFAHCIGADYVLGAGIALQFRSKYKSLVPSLKEVGDNSYPTVIKYTDNDGTIIYNLVTKQTSYIKPTRRSLYESIWHLREFLIKDNVKEINIPLLGAGLDKLSWGNTQEFIEKLFKDDDIRINVYYLTKGGKP